MLKELIEELCKDNYTTEWDNLNYKLVPITVINARIGEEYSFNNIYQELIKLNYKPITRTRSGGISISCKEKFNVYKYDVRTLNGCSELTICNIPGIDEFRTYRIQWRIDNYKDAEDNEQLITGRQSFNKFSYLCKKHNIDLNKYIVDNGEEINKEINKPDIRLHSLFQHRVLDNVHHIDFHKFYMMGLLKSHPEFEPVITELNEKAKVDKKYKTIMASVIGFMHSKHCNYKYAKLSKDAINTAYEFYYKVMAELKKEHIIIATNTDGIWYKGNIFSGLYESKDIGGWSNDHINCKIRFKSAGAYEYIENDVYTAVVRGRTNLDKIKSRDKWSWGDIYDRNANIQLWSFKEGVGIVWQEQLN